MDIVAAQLMGQDQINSLSNLLNTKSNILGKQDSATRLSPSTVVEESVCTIRELCAEDGAKCSVATYWNFHMSRCCIVAGRRNTRTCGYIFNLCRAKTKDLESCSCELAYLQSFSYRTAIIHRCVDLAAYFQPCGHRKTECIAAGTIVISLAAAAAAAVSQANHFLRQKSLENDLRRSLGDGDVISIKGPIGTVLLLLDCHREFFQSFVIKPAFPQHAGQLTRQRLLVVVTSEERNRFATPSPTTYESISNFTALGH